MAAAAVDVGYLAGHLGLESPDVLSQAIEAPTTQIVLEILNAVAAKALEFDELYAAKLRADIELENARQSTENKYLASKATADKSLQDAQDLRQKLRDEETARARAESELYSIKSTIDSHDAEVTSLRQRIDTLQDSSRANLSVLEERNSRIEELSQELTQRHQKNIDLNKEISAASQKLREAEAAVNTSRYREESLKQQLELAARNAEWFEKEVKAKGEEATKFRREKGARIAELTRQNEEAKNELDALRRSEQQLRERLEAAQSKADDVLVKFQKQQETFSRTEESYKQEIKDQKRLVGMSQEYSRKHQERVHELEAEKERVRNDSDNEIRRVRVDLERAMSDCATYEERIRQLETDLDETRARVTEPAPIGSAPQTPRLGGASVNNGRASPFATPGSIRKSGLTLTQALDEYYKIKGELARERRRNEQLSEEMEQLMVSLEAKAPEIHGLEEETQKLRLDVTRMSELSQQSFEERDAAKKSLRRAEGELSTVRAELHITRTQLRDLSMQIRMLVFNLQAHEKGMQYLTPDEQERFKALAEGKLGDDLADMSEADQYITQRFTIFRDIHELQSRNEDLNRTIREVSLKMQQQEELIKQHDAAKAHETIEVLERELANMVDEARSMKTTMESYKAERDMFRRLLQQKASAGELASVLGHSVEDGQRPPLASIEAGTGEDGPSSAAALRQLQSLYDDFRSQQADIHRTLQGTIDELKDEKSRLQGDVTRITSQEALTSQRYEMLQSNYQALQSEVNHVKESNRNLSTNAVGQENRLEALSEELVSAKSHAESMQKEASNLRTEKDLWQGIHTRLTQDNENLMQEKGRLNSLLATNQALLNERDISESEYRRNAQTRIESLESELSSTKEKLSKEVEEGRQLQQRKDYETKNLQERVDKTLEAVREKGEKLASLTTTNDHLQARVNELTAELRNAEDRFGRLLPRATPRAGHGGSGSDADASNAIIQELRDEIDELKRELDVARTNLENVREQLEHQKDIGRNTEEALESAVEARNALEQELQGAISAKATQIDELTQRVSDISAELANSNNELSRLRDSQGEVVRKYEAEKGVLDEENRRLREEAQRHSEVAKYHQQDLRTQAEIATQAQQDYEAELVKHAEAAKQLQALRVQHTAVRTELAKVKAEAEAAQLSLNQNETSWGECEARLTQEIFELKTRRDDINAQNRILHEQLDGLTQQIGVLQQNRSATAQPLDAATLTNDTNIDSLRELNSYLRREKEIVEVQLDIKTSEARRLQEQTDVLGAELDEVRLKLEQERRAHADSGKNSLSHKELMDKLHELNLYRESSATLRSELEQARNTITDRAVKIEELSGRIQPLQAEIEGLQTQKTYLEEEIKSVQEDRDRWQKRTEGILTKYGRIDPVEMEQLKQKASELETERDALKEAEGPLRAELDTIKASLETERANWATTREKLVAQFKDRSKRLTGEKNEAVARVQELEQELSTATANTTAANERATSAQEQMGTLQQQVTALQAQVDTQPPSQPPQPTQTTDAAEPGVGASDEVVARLEQQLSDLQQQLDDVASQKMSAVADLQTVRQQLQAVQTERDEAIAKSQALASAQPAQPPTQPPAAEPTAQQTDAIVVAGSAEPLTDSERQQLEQKIAAAEATIAELRARVAELEGQISDAEAKAAEAEAKVQDYESNHAKIIKERSDKMKVALNEKLKESRAKLEEEFKLKMEQERAIMKAEMPPTPVKATSAPVPPTTPVKVPETADAFAALAKMSDNEVRQFLASHQTLKNIMSNNIKKMAAIETAKVKAEYESKKAEGAPSTGAASAGTDQAHLDKLKTEWEAKVSAARDAGEQLATQRSKVRISMLDKKAAVAGAKLAVVEKAANETPEKPVGEVWAVAKVANPPPPPPASTPGQTPAGGATTTPVIRRPPPAAGAAVPPSPAGLPATPTPQSNGPAPNPFSASAQGHHPLPVNPFAAPTAQQSPFATIAPPGQAPTAVPPNPFASAVPIPAASVEQAPQQPQPQQLQQPQQIPAHAAQPQQQTGTAQAPGPTRSGIPTRGGGPGRGGPGRGGRGGRGSGIPRAGGMNPHATEFQQGNKRPRGDSEIGGGAGAKRPRGG